MMLAIPIAIFSEIQDVRYRCMQMPEEAQAAINGSDLQFGVLTTTTCDDMGAMAANQVKGGGYLAAYYCIDNANQFAPCAECTVVFSAKIGSKGTPVQPPWGQSNNQLDPCGMAAIGYCDYNTCSNVVPLLNSMGQRVTCSDLVYVANQ
jgi:hypothetical protein